MGQLYINDRLVDFSDRTIISITKQINDIASIDKVKGDTTNSFKLPMTKNNLDILGLPGDVNFSAGFEYKKLKARYIEEGEELIPFGSATIDEVTDVIDLKVIAGNIEFFDLIDGSIRDLNLNAFNHSFNKANVLASMVNVTGFIYPIIDYGQLSKDGRLVDARHLRPCFYVHTLIDAIFAHANHTPLGDIFSDPDYLSEIIPLTSELKPPQGSDIGFGFTATKAIAQDNSDAGDFFKVSFPDTSNSNANTGGKWDAVNNRYIFLKSGNVKFSGKFIVYGNNSTPATFTVRFVKNGDIYNSFAVGEVEVKYPDDGEITIESENTLFFAGDYVEVYARRDDKGWSDMQEVKAGSSITLTVGDFTYGSLLSIADSLPDISMKDFIKSFMFRYGLIAETDNVKKNVTFRSFDDLQKNIPFAKDWSDKLDVSKPETINFNIGNYCQHNYLRYKEDDNVKKQFGDGDIFINDQTLDLKKDLFTLPFAASESVIRLKDFKLANVLMVDPTNTNTDGTVKMEFTLRPQPRILRVYRRGVVAPDAIKLHEGDVTVFTSLNNGIAVGYFYIPGLSNLDFPSLIATRYKQLNRTLTLTKRIGVSLRLTPTDIADFSHFIPVYIRKYGFNFYVNKINGYQEGDVTKVELIRL